MDERIANMHLPQAVVARILKEENITASKESRDMMSRATAVFMLHLSGMACENAQNRYHKVVAAEDVLRALRTLDCDNLYSPCKQVVEDWKVLKAQKAANKKRSAAPTNESPSKRTPVVESPQGSAESTSAEAE
ncbi:unnamed protein product [Caenorhabditis auriculariae]|uniref:DNA polymerase epsilon subunit 3 n=1 Tax=Caenorhabditis auriculariae TaxID=2777116 RepID=A0A8S1H1X9_9PELO|nr:unnamed protein product [Caenorhabditis auriculariae]